MSGAPAERLAGWRAARAVRSVASVAGAVPQVATGPEAQETADVATVARAIDQTCNEVAARAAFYRAASVLALEGLAVPDADLAAERAEIQAAREAEERGNYRMVPEAEHRAHVAALRLGALQRPPAWSDVTSAPWPGAWCEYCGRHAPQDGGRWWREAHDPTGWRCWTCHPPLHLAAGDTHEVWT